MECTDLCEDSLKVQLVLCPQGSLSSLVHSAHILLRFSFCKSWISLSHFQREGSFLSLHRKGRGKKPENEMRYMRKGKEKGGPKFWDSGALDEILATSSLWNTIRKPKEAKKTLESWNICHDAHKLPPREETLLPTQSDQLGFMVSQFTVD